MPRPFFALSISAALGFKNFANAALRVKSLPTPGSEITIFEVLNLSACLGLTEQLKRKSRTVVAMYQPELFTVSLPILPKKSHNFLGVYL